MKNCKYMRRVAALAAGAVMLCCMTGCKTPQNVTMFQDASPETVIELAQARPMVARPGDKLIILVKAKDPQVSALFNPQAYSTTVDNQVSSLEGRVSTSQQVPQQSLGVTSYTVGPDGNIDFPVLGPIHIGGMTRQEIQGYIKGELVGRELVKDPVITVEFLNAGVNVLGDVRSPGRIELNKDRLTITEAIARAGDLTLTGKRDNVKVLRKEGDKVRTYVVDLTNAGNTMSSPAYYLQQDDIVYVEPNEMQKRSTVVNGNSAMNVSFWISVASLLTTVATTVGVFVNK